MTLELEEKDFDVIAAKIAERLKLRDSRKADDTIFDVQGLTKYLHVSTKWIYERTHLKEIPYIKIKGRLMFRKRDIDRWLDTHVVPTVNKLSSISHSLIERVKAIK